MGDQLRFVDDSGDTRLAGQLVDDGATVGDVLTVQSDGSLAAAAGGGSSSAPVNWCIAQINPASPLTPGSPSYDVLEADINIFAQSGSDFSVGTDPNYTDGAVISAAGGVFQAMVMFVDAAIAGTLGAASDPRYVGYGLSMGPSVGGNQPFSSAGIDDAMPVPTKDGAVHSFGIHKTTVGNAGYVPPNTSAWCGAFLTLHNGQTDDSLTVSSFSVYLWQTGVLPT